MAEKTQQKVRNYFLGGLLLLAFILVFLVLRPYLISFILALVLAIIFRPMFLAILKYTGNRDVLAAILTTLAVLIIILVPFIIFGSLLFKEIAGFLNSPDQTFNRIATAHLPGFVEKLNLDFKSYFHNLLTGFVNDAGKIFSNLAEFFIYLILTITSLIYIFKDGHKIKDALLGALPFTKAQEQKLTTDMAIGIRAVIGGYLLVAIIQGIVSGMGFWIFGIPNPALWGFITILAALIPTFGTSLVNIPAILFLFFTHNLGHAVGLTIWWIIAISIIDNYIGPRFISGRVKIHVLLLIFSIIGGIKLFGTMGFIVGPLIIIFFWSVMEMFRAEPTFE